MGDGWEIETSSEKIQSVHLSTRTCGVSQMTNSQRNPQEISKFDLDLKSPSHIYTERNDIERLNAISLADTKTISLVQDVKFRQPQREGKVDSSCAVVGNSGVEALMNSVQTGQESASVFADNSAVNTNSDMSMETKRVPGKTFPPLKYQSSSFKAIENTEDAFCLREKDFPEEKPRDMRNLSAESKTNGHENEAVISSKEENPGMTTLREELHIMTEGGSEMQNKSRAHVQEKDHSKRKPSFRALVRMKGLGRKMRKKHKLNKFVNNRTESQMREFKSDSSAKYLLDSSTSTSEELTFTQMKVTHHENEREKCCPSAVENKTSKTTGKEYIFQNLDEGSSSENVCSSGYLGRRRGAVCEELEKTLLCGEQTLADLRAILVVQQKLTGFGLL
jgi:hypothetical protein